MGVMVMAYFMSGRVEMCTVSCDNKKMLSECWSVGESWGMANDGQWRTGQYLVEGVKVIK